MGYRLQYRREAVSFLKRLSVRERVRIIYQLERLAENPGRRDLDVKRLSGHSGWRLRLGKYRVVYRTDENQLQILVIRVRPRGDVYKGLKQ